MGHPYPHQRGHEGRGQEIGGLLLFVTQKGTCIPIYATKQVETVPDLVVSPSLTIAGQILGDTMRQDIGEGQRLVNALLKDRVRKGQICHQERFEMRRAGTMGRCEKTVSRASHVPCCHCSLLTG